MEDQAGGVAAGGGVGGAVQGVERLERVGLAGLLRGLG